MNPRQHISRKDRGRGFALPLVILLTLVVGLGVAVLFQRHGVAALAARRQADDYIHRHAGLGMRELISRWLTTVRGKLQESLDSDGFAFSLALPDGGRVDVTIEDAQGTILSRTDDLTGRRREIVELMNYTLKPLAPELREQLTRQHGPSEISIESARPEVLLALASAIAGPDAADDVMRSLTQRRDDQAPGRTLTMDQIARALSEARMEPPQIAEFQAMLTTTPTLWLAIAEVKGSGGRVLERAGGLIEINSERIDPFNQNGPFLTWDLMPLEEAEESPNRR